MGEFTGTDGERIATAALLQMLREQGVEIKEIGSDVKDMRERLIRVEESGLGRSVDQNRDRIIKLEGKVDLLEHDRARRDGASKLFEFLMRVAPWAVGGAAFAIGQWALEIGAG